MTETSEQNPGQTSEANGNNRGAHIGMDGWGELVVVEFHYRELIIR